MIKVKVDGEILEFKNYREAHHELDLSRDCKSEGCTAARLEHYCDLDMTHDDFGVEIGRECVEYTHEIIEDGKEIDAAEIMMGDR